MGASVARQVVITGMGVVTPVGTSIDTFWSSLLSGASGARKITEFDVNRCRSTAICTIPAYDSYQHFDRREAQRLSRASQFAILAAEQALQDSENDFGALDRDRVGVLMGICTNSAVVLEDYMRDFY